MMEVNKIQAVLGMSQTEFIDETNRYYCEDVAKMSSQNFFNGNCCLSWYHNKLMNVGPGLKPWMSFLENSSAKYKYLI